MFNRRLKRITGQAWHQQPALALVGNRPVCVEPTATVKEAVAKLHAAQTAVGVPAPIARGIRDLLVTGDGTPKTTLLGLVNEFDLGKAEANNLIKVAEIMAPFDETGKRYPYLTKQSSVRDALRLFIKPLLQPFHNTSYFISGLPILHQHDYSIAGLLTPGDIMVAINSENLPLLKEAVKVHVIEHEAVLAGNALTDIAALMRNRGYLNVPVVEDTDSLKLLGMITQQKMIEAYQLDLDERDKMQAAAIMMPFEQCFTIADHEPLATAVKIFSRNHAVGMLLVIADNTSRRLAGFIGRIQIFQLILDRL